MYCEIFRRKKMNTDYLFKSLYEMFHIHVYKTAFYITKDHYTAQDVVQETFIKVHQNIDKLEDGSKMKPWISTIATRTAIDFIRKQKGVNEFGIEDFDKIKLISTERTLTVEEVIEKVFLNEWIRAEIHKLSPEYRSVLHFKYIKDLKDQEIANVLGLSVATVKTRIHRAKYQLKKKISIEAY